MHARLLHACFIIPFCVILTCFAAQAEESDSDGIAYFEEYIRPLFVERCYACHSQSGKADRIEGGLRLDTRPGWQAGGTRGPVIVPGDADASILIHAVRYTDPDLQMPPDEPLSADEVARLEQWVQMGAPDPRVQPLVASSSDPSSSDPQAGRDHWAYQPLRAPSIPAVGERDWPRSPIDSFVLATLESKQLGHVGEAGRRTLIRRLYFQLHGLPPSNQDIDQFLADARPDAVERLVDQLLSSPRFGERWGRHWLDLARYADSNGLDENFLFREAWRYRNWVIAALNADQSFDRFLLEQIAGDLLPSDSIELRDRQRIATGFLVIGPKVLLGNNPQNQKLEVADEQLDTIGRAVLGQTLGCARCHDHKFDPIPTADYYALAGIFTSTRVMEERHMLGEQRVMEQLIGIGAEGDALDNAYEQYWRTLPEMREQLEHAQAALALLEKGDAEAEAFKAFAEQHSSAVCTMATDTAQTLEVRIRSQRNYVDELKSSIGKPPAIPPRAMIATDEATPADEFIRAAGKFDKPTAQVPRGFLQALETETTIQVPSSQSGRVELAKWLTDVEAGAGNLTARVLANRIWYHLMGRGIVRTVDNFGRTGEPPTHPELLDYLAQRLIDSGWSVKSLVREIVLSRTFALSSQHHDALAAVDPDNVWLWRAHRRRLDPESLRDAMLLAARELDLSSVNSTVWYLDDQATAVGDNKNRRRTDFPCRSVYLPVIRNDLPEVFEALDFANPHATTGMRPQTMVPSRGLFMLNNELVMNTADSLATKLLQDPSLAGDSAKMIDLMFESITNVRPTDEQRAALSQLISELEQQLTTEGAADARLRAWSLACHAVFASSYFQIVE